MASIDQWEQMQLGGVNCIHLSAIIINITVSTYWDQMKQMKEPPVYHNLHAGLISLRETFPIVFL